MQANELRIGNWVICREKLKKVTAVDDVGINGEYCDCGEYGGMNYDGQFGNFFRCSEIEPIPLTPEILEKAGFEKDGQQYELNRVVLFFIFNRFEYHYNAGCQDFIEVRFVHQLQNLYWCLCGEELDIKL